MTLEELVDEYSALQAAVIADFLSEVTPTDTELFRDIEPTGQFSSVGGRWCWRRHGAGIEFTREADSVVVDAHVGMVEAPTAVDGWRLSLYAESRGLSHVDCGGQSVMPDSERELVDRLRVLVPDVLVEQQTKSGARLLVPRSS